MNMTNHISVTPENIQATLGTENKIVLLNFFSAQHPDCLSQQESLRTLTLQYEDTLVLATLDCDLQAMLASQLAQQIGLQALPTTVILRNGSPLDIVQGKKSVEEFTQLLSDYLPAPEEMYLQEAQKALSVGDLNKAYELSKKAIDTAPENLKAQLVYADLCIQLNKTQDARSILEAVSENERDAYYVNLMQKLGTAELKKEDPEILALREQVANNESDLGIRESLATKLRESGQNEEALDVLLSILKKDMNFGESKKAFLDIIASLPSGDKTALDYRRKLYSLLY